MEHALWCVHCFCAWWGAASKAPAWPPGKPSARVLLAPPRWPPAARSSWASWKSACGALQQMLRVTSRGPCKRPGASPTSAPRSESSGKKWLFFRTSVSCMSHKPCAQWPSWWAEQAGRLPYLPALPLRSCPGGLRADGAASAGPLAALWVSDLSPEIPKPENRSGLACSALPVSFLSGLKGPWTVLLLLTPCPWHTLQIDNAKPRPASRSFPSVRARQHFPLIESPDCPSQP